MTQSIFSPQNILSAISSITGIIGAVLLLQGPVLAQDGGSPFRSMAPEEQASQEPGAPAVSQPQTTMPAAEQQPQKSPFTSMGENEPAPMPQPQAAAPREDKPAPAANTPFTSMQTNTAPPAAPTSEKTPDPAESDDVLEIIGGQDYEFDTYPTTPPQHTVIIDEPRTQHEEAPTSEPLTLETAGDPLAESSLEANPAPMAEAPAEPVTVDKPAEAIETETRETETREAETREAEVQETDVQALQEIEAAEAEAPAEEPVAQIAMPPAPPIEAPTVATSELAAEEQPAAEEAVAEELAPAPPAPVQPQVGGWSNPDAAGRTETIDDGLDPMRDAMGL